MKFRSVLNEFAIDDVFLMTFMGGGYALGVIGRLNAERMYCSTFFPTFAALPDRAALDTWEPTGWSRWVTDTLCLRDGSCTKIDGLAAIEAVRKIDAHTLPRFRVGAGTEKKIVEYDPETLVVRGFVDATDLAEYEKATPFIPPDSTTFEIAVAHSAGFPGERPDQATVDLLNSERLVVATLREMTSDVDVEHVFDHEFVFKRATEAQRVRSEMQGEGFDVSDPVTTGRFKKETSFEIHVRSKPEYPLVRDDIAKMRALAQRFGAAYDGFGAEAI